MEGQQEIYISSDPLQTTSIQGVSLSGEAKKYFTSLIAVRTRYDLSYFYEKAIAEKTTILFEGGFSYYQIRKEYFSLYNASTSYSNLNNKYNSNNLLFGLSIEPRYYFSLNQRATDKRGGLNSGWFIGLPLELSIILNKPASYYYNKDNLLINDNKLSGKDRLKYTAGLNLGYRYAVTNNLFAEAALGLTYINNNDFYVDYHWALFGKVSLAYSF